MACSVLWTERAQQDLDRVIDYIANALSSPRAAARLLDGFQDAVERVARMPELYAVSSQPSLAARNLRPCYVKNYVILYTYDKRANVVTLYRIFSTLQDYARLV